MPQELKQLTRREIISIVQELLDQYQFPFRTVGPPQFMSSVAPPAGGSKEYGIKISNIKDLGIFFGSGVPTLVAAQGSLYLRTNGSSTSTRAYINTNGADGWTSITTAA